MDDPRYFQVVPPPEPPDVLRDAVAYLHTAHDTRATALIDGLAAEVHDLRTDRDQTADRLSRYAHLIVRSAMALADEGIGPDGDPVDTDEQTYTEAVALVRSEFADHELWDFGLIDDAEHTGDGCDRCVTRQRNWGTRS